MKEREEGIQGIPIGRLDRWIAAAGFLCSLFLYWRTLATDILMGDSGEFQVLAVTGGLAHPTGYPIYLFIAKLFTWLPVGSIAMRVSLLSAVMAALAVALTYLLARALEVRRVYAAVAAALLAINPLFWWQSVIAEVYTITAAFLAAFLLCALLWGRTRHPGWLAAGGVLGGLCWGLHHTAVLTLPAVLLYLAVSKAGKKDWSSAVMGSVAGLAIAMAAYMVMGSIDSNTTSTHSVRPSASAYGMKPEEFDAPLTRTLFVMNARQWKSEFAKKEEGQTSKNLSKYIEETTGGLGWPATLLAPVGALFVFAKRWREGVLLVGSWLALFVYILVFRAFDIEVNYLLGYIPLMGLVAAALQGLQNLAFKRPIANAGLRIGTGLAAAAILFLGVTPVLSGAWKALQDGKPTFLTGEDRQLPFPVDYPAGPHDYATAMVHNVEPNALIITLWEYLYPIYYVARFEDNRPDIEVVEANPMGTEGILTESMKAYLRDSVAKRPVYVTGILATMRDTYDFQEVIPGQLYRMTPR